MIHVKFKNLEKSELAREAAVDRLSALEEKFPDLIASRVAVTLEMENSPMNPGPDFFTVKVFISGGRYKGTTVIKSSPNLYKALADVVDHLLERLNRLGDRVRVKERTVARKMLRVRPLVEEEA